MAISGRICALAGTLVLSSIAYADDTSTNFDNLFYEHIPSVITAPLFGDQSAQDGSDLLYGYSATNHDLQLLNAHQSFTNYLTKKEVTNDRPVLVLGGAFEGNFIMNDESAGSTDFNSSIGTAELETAAFINPWVSGFISLDYQNLPTVTGNRNPQNTIYLNMGYATIGNLDVSPFYLSMGKMYMPFGRYNTAMWSTPETASLAQIQDTATLLGYSKNGVYAEAFAYNTYQTSNNAFSEEGGANLGYKNSDGSYPFEIGASYVSNMADSLGMRDTGYGDDVSTDFEGFEVNNVDLVHDVPGANVYGSVGIRQFTLIGEYFTATESFDQKDLSFNNEGATPKALQAELDYSFTAYNKPSLIGFLYGETWESLALNLPKESYNFVASTSVWRDTIQAVEYSYNKNYSTSDSATGDNLDGPSAGGHSNVVTMVMGFYF
ncbi:MAG: hypothetical protein CL816_08680 [Coxiellaceae bacterium]|nr:hypothetical protein [Coxiellaceae bacterium]